MKNTVPRYKRHQFPPEIIQCAVWLYYRFNLSRRDIEDLLARRGIVVTHESIRLWCNKFGPLYAHRLRRRHRGYGDTFFLDEVFVRIQGDQRYLWRAVDQDGEVVDVPVERFSGPAEKINITVPGRLLKQIDEHARAHGETRSGFLTKSALQAMRRA